MRYICITKTNQFQTPKHEIISINDFVNGETGIDKKDCIKMIGDFTNNFSDLGFWNAMTDLNGKTINDVVQKILNILQTFNEAGFIMRKWTEEDEKSYTIPAWMFGHCHKKNSIIPVTLSDDERISILMFHLNDLMETIKKYDSNYYLFIDDGK